MRQPPASSSAPAAASPRAPASRCAARGRTRPGAGGEPAAGTASTGTAPGRSRGECRSAAILILSGADESATPARAGQHRKRWLPAASLLYTQVRGLMLAFLLVI